MLSGVVCVYADEVEGRMSATFGYALNDMIFEYGVIKTINPGDGIREPDDVDIAPGGIVYADVIKFEENYAPYLVVFTANSVTRCAQVHIWKYNEQDKTAEKIAILEKPYSTIDQNKMGEFCVGYNDEKRYISYREYENDIPVYEEYYTVINGDAFMYVNKPKNVYDVGVMNFNRSYFRPGVDVSYYNKTLGNFFMYLKNQAADSVTYDDIAERLKTEDEAQLEEVLSKAVGYTDFDISSFKSMQEYLAELEKPNCNDRFYLITNMYNLDDEIYYVRYSTDRSFYNYALLRRTESLESGYQILKVRADCIPLSDSELKQIKEDYSRCTLLMKKASGSLELEEKESFIKEKLPKIDVDKRWNSDIKLPAAIIGAVVILALAFVLCFVLISDDEKK